MKPKHRGVSGYPGQQIQILLGKTALARQPSYVGFEGHQVKKGLTPFFLIVDAWW